MSLIIALNMFCMNHIMATTIGTKQDFGLRRLADRVPSGVLNKFEISNLELIRYSSIY